MQENDSAIRQDHCCSCSLTCCSVQRPLVVAICSTLHRSSHRSYLSAHVNIVPPQLRADDAAGTSLGAGMPTHHPQPHQPYLQQQSHQQPQAALSGDPWRLAAAQQQQQHLQQQQQQQCLAPGSPTDTSMGDDWQELATGLQQPHQQEQLLHQYAQHQQQEPLLEPASLLDVSAI